MEYRYYLVILACIFIVYLLATRKVLEIEKEEKKQDNAGYKILKLVRIIALALLLLTGVYFIGHTIVGLF